MTTHDENADDRRQRIILEATGKLEQAGFNSEDLDDLVHDCASSVAADINNDGVQAQLEYLFEHNGAYLPGVIEQLVCDRQEESA